MKLSEAKSGEARINALKNKIARDVMSLVKGVLPENSEVNFEDSEFETSVTLTGYVWTKNIDASVPMSFDPEVDDMPGSNLLFDVVVNMKTVSDFDHPFDIHAYALSDITIPEMEIVIIKRDPVLHTSNLQDFRKDLGNAIRHELEHFTQKGMFKSFDRGERYYDFSVSGNVNSSQAEYFLKSEEVPAFVKGFSDHASSIEDLEKSMREMLDRYADAGKISQIEEDIILNAWLDWARRNLNKMKFK